MRTHLAFLLGAPLVLLACGDDSSGASPDGGAFPDAPTVVEPGPDAPVVIEPGADAPPPPVQIDAESPPIADAGTTAAPWPVDKPLVLGGPQGLQEMPLQASTDEGRNLWVVTPAALYVMRPGDTSFRRYTTADGLRAWPLRSVAGGGVDQVFVGYEGVFGPDPDADPIEIKKSGDLDRIQLRPDGSLDVYHFDLHNSNTPVSGKYDESRIIVKILYAHDGPRRGEVYVGTSHGATRIIGNDYADHRHPSTLVTNADGTTTQKFGDLGGLALTADGDLLVGNFYKVARLGPTVVLDDWWQSHLNPWRWATHAWPGESSERITVTGIAVAPDGTMYFGSFGRGIAVLPADDRGEHFTYLAPPDMEVMALAADPDGTLWVGTRRDFFRYDPKTGTFTPWGAADGLLDSGVGHLYLDTTVSPRALVITGRDGQVAIYRGP